MNFDLTPDQAAIQTLAGQFAVDVVAPAIDDYVRRGAFPTPIIRKAAELGLFGIALPEEYGGAGAGYLTFALALEEIARVDPSTAVIIFTSTSPATLLKLFASPEQKQQWLVPLAAGQILGAIAITEPHGGSDVSAIRTRAERRDGGWLLNGGKIFITNSGNELSGLIVVVAVTGQVDAKQQLSCFLVPSGTPGLAVGPKIETLGWRAADSREVFLSDVWLPDDHLIGEQGQGLKQVLTTLTYGRLGIAACAVGLARGAYDRSFSYAREREQFGRPIAQFQGVSFKLADMATSVDAARLLLWKAAADADAGRNFRLAASKAKLFATEAAMQAAHQAIQIHGSYGVSLDYSVSKLLGDAKVLEIVEGTSEVQRALIGTLLGC
jgi:short/branched chain acyl-CoA dehydrogenase